MPQRFARSRSAESPHRKAGTVSEGPAVSSSHLALTATVRVRGAATGRVRASAVSRQFRSARNRGNTLVSVHIRPKTRTRVSVTGSSARRRARAPRAAGMYRTVAPDPGRNSLVASRQNRLPITTPGPASKVRSESPLPSHREREAVKAPRLLRHGTKRPAVPAGLVRSGTNVGHGSRRRDFSRRGYSFSSEEL